MTFPDAGVLLSIGFLVLVGCNQRTEAPTQTPSVPKPPEISAKVEKLEGDLTMLQNRVDDLEFKLADVDTEVESYGVAKTNFGAFTVTARSVTPYLDGFKVKLGIGNLTSATFHGAKISVGWGLGDRKNKPLEYYMNLKDKDFDVTKQFSPGAYTDVEVVLTPAKPEEVKTLVVGIQLNHLSLRGR